MQQITCFTCGTQATQMLTIVCEHSICIECAVRILSKNKQSLKSFRCQICSIITPLDQQTIQSLIKPIKPIITTQQPLLDLCNCFLKEQVSLFCFTCQSMPFCTECYIAGMHNSHDVKTLVKGYSQLKQKIIDPLDRNLIRATEDLLEDELTATRNKQSLLDILLQTKDQIRSTFTELIQDLQEKERQLIEEVDQLVHPYFYSLQQTQDIINTQLQNLQSLRDSTSSFNNENTTAFTWVSQQGRFCRQLLETISEFRKLSRPDIKITFMMDTFQFKEMLENQKCIRITIDKTTDLSTDLNTDLYIDLKEPKQTQYQKYEIEKNTQFDSPQTKIQTEMQTEISTEEKQVYNSYELSKCPSIQTSYEISKIPVNSQPERFKSFLKSYSNQSDSKVRLLQEITSSDKQLITSRSTTRHIPFSLNMQSFIRF